MLSGDKLVGPVAVGVIFVWNMASQSVPPIEKLANVCKPAYSFKTYVMCASFGFYLKRAI